MQRPGFVDYILTLMYICIKVVQSASRGTVTANIFCSADQIEVAIIESVQSRNMSVSCCCTLDSQAVWFDPRHTCESCSLMWVVLSCGVWCVVCVWHVCCVVCGCGVSDVSPLNAVCLEFFLIYTDASEVLHASPLALLGAPRPFLSFQAL